MTNAEAMKNLKKLKSFHNGSYGTAIDIAIKALEQTDKIEKSNFSTEQYKVDLQGAYDCGYAKALEQQPSEPRTNLAETSQDCISRKAVIEYITANYGFCHNLIDEIKAMPSVTPERPKGKWVHKMQVMNNPYTYKCSVCKGWEKDKTKYCPNCGADMRAGGEE